MADNHKYYYLKLKENFYDTDAMILLESMPDGYLYSNILMKLYLRSLHSEGRLMFNDKIPFNSTMIAKITRHQVGTVEKAIKVFRDLGLVEILDNGAIYMTDIQNFIGRGSSEAERKRLYRSKIEAEKKLLSGTNSGTLSGTTSTRDRDRDRDRDREESIDVESRKKETGTSGDGLKDVITAYRKNIYPMPGEMDLEKLKAMIEDFGSDAVIKAIDRAVTRNKRSLAYIHGILKSWQADGYDDENMVRPQSSPRNSKKAAIDTVNRLMAEYQAQEGEKKDDSRGSDPESDWGFATGVSK